MIKCNDVMPWQKSQWAFLTEHERLPHALILSGQKGLGKLHIALAFANYLQCTKQVDARACGECSSCHLSSVGNHPDIQLVEGEGASDTIKIDRVREIVDWAAKSSQLGHYKIIILKRAERMNTASANALLKTLEEPLGKTLFLLVTDYPSLLPATIRSRCQSVNFPATFSRESVNWLDAMLAGKQDAKQLLHLSGGAPLVSLAMAKDDLMAARQRLFEGLHALITRKISPLMLAADLNKQPLVNTLDFLAAFSIDIVQMQSCGADAHTLNQDGLQSLQSIAQTIPLTRLYAFYDKVLTSKRDLMAGLNLNPQLLLEDLMINLSEITLVKRKAA